MLEPSDFEFSKLRLQPFSLDIIDPRISRKFHLDNRRTQILYLRYYILLIAIFIILYLLILRPKSFFNERFFFYGILWIFLYLIAFWLILGTSFFEKKYTFLKNFLFGLGFCNLIGLYWALNDDDTILMISCLASCFMTLNLDLKLKYIIISNLVFFFIFVGKYFFCYFI